MAKHPATPWSFDGYGVNDADGRRIATMRRPETPESQNPEPWAEMKARAELFAAAPDLLAFAEAAVPFIQQWLHSDEAADELWPGLMAALMKVHGCASRAELLAKLDGRPWASQPLDGATPEPAQPEPKTFTAYASGGWDCLKQAQHTLQGSSTWDDLADALHQLIHDGEATLTGQQAKRMIRLFEAAGLDHELMIEEN